MRPTFRLKLTATYLSLIIIILVISGISLFNIFRDYYIKNVESSLLHEARLLDEMIKMTTADKPHLQQICNTAGKNLNSRITIIDQYGEVLADSMYNPAKLGPHNSRPEVYQALHGKNGVEIRYSDTYKSKMIYVAVPFQSSEIKGALRLATPLLEVEEFYSRMWYILLLAIILTGLLAFGLSLVFVEKFSRPVRDVTRAVREMAHGNLKKRISYRNDDELGIMVRAFNEMAQYLEQNIQEISDVKNRLQTLLQNTVNGIIMIDPNARITYVNPAAVALLGDAAADIGKKHVEVINNYEIVETIDTVRQQFQPIKKEVVLHTLGDKIVDVSVVPLKDDKVFCQGVLVVLNDITDIKRLEQVRKDFVANVSHELKTPVATISGFAETLVEEGQESRNISEFAGIIYDEAARLSRLINRLLELSRLESEDRVLQKIPVDVSKLIERTIISVQTPSQCKNIQIEFNSDRPVIIEGDPDIITQIILNLLDNAIKFSSEGSTVNIQLEEQLDYIRISVKDAGIGIPSQEISRIFERFYRVDKARSRKTGGTGLGLSIVKHLVEKHGGYIEVESIEGKGSIFTVTLPHN